MDLDRFRKEGLKYKIVSTLLLVFLGIAFASNHPIAQKKECAAVSKEHTCLLLNERKIPYVLQEQKIYLYLEDVLKNGFILDVQSGGYTQDETAYRYVLWTKGLVEDVKYNASSPAEISKLPVGVKEEIYINGLQIGCYSLEQKPMIALSEFASVSDDILTEGNKPYSKKAVFFDEEGTPLALEENIVQGSKNLKLTIDGAVESCIDFKNCSPYLIQHSFEKAKATLSLQAIQADEFVITENERLLLKKIYAGELRGFRMIALMDGYINFTAAAEQAGISFKIDKGILSIKGHPKKPPLYLETSEPLGTLHYYRGRVFQIALKDGKGNDLDCLFTGDTLYINKKDLGKIRM